jgi:hypothetical protein
LKHFVVPETQDQIAACFEGGSASIVFCTSRTVLSAIDLNDQARGLATEIDDVPVDWHLAAEFQAGKASVPQPEPQSSLRIGLMTTKFSGGGGMRDHNPSPARAIARRRRA